MKNIIACLCCLITLNSFSQNIELLFPFSHREQIKNVYLSPNADYAITTDYHTAILWEVNTGKSIRKFDNYFNQGQARISFSPTGENFIIGLSGSIGFYETRSGNLIRSFEGENISAFFFLENGNNLLILDEDSIKTIEIITGQLKSSYKSLYTLVWPDYSSEPNTFELSDDEQFIFCKNSNMLSRISLESNQKTEYVDTAGQGDNISCYTVDKSGKFIAVNYTLGETVIFETKSGKVESRMGIPADVMLIDENKVPVMIWKKNDPGIINNANGLEYEKYYPNLGADNIFFENDSTLILLKDKTITKWDIKRKFKLRELELSFRFSKNIIHFSNNEYLLLNSDSLYIIDGHNLKIRKFILPKKIGISNSSITDGGPNFSYSKKRNFLLTKDSIGNCPLVLDLRSYKEYTPFKKGIPDITSTALYQNDNSEILFTAYATFCLGWNINTAEVVFRDSFEINEEHYLPDFERTTVRVSQSKKFLLIEYGGYKLRIFNLKNFSLSKEIIYPGMFDLSANDQLVYRQYESGKISNILFSLNSATEYILSEDSTFADFLKVSPNGNFFVMIKQDTVVEIFDVKEKTIAFSKYKNWRNDISDIKFSPDEKYFAIQGVETENLPIFASQTGEQIALLFAPRKDGGYENLNWTFFDKEGKGLYAQFGNLYYLTLSSGSIKIYDTYINEIHFVNDSTFWTFEEDTMLFYSYDSYGNLLLKTGVKSLSGGEININGNYAFITTRNGVNLYKYNNYGFQALAKFYTLDFNNSFLISEPYYKASKQAAETLRFINDKNIYSFEQFDVRYNRPDIVLKSLGSTDTALIRSYGKAYEKRISKLGIDTSSFKSGYSMPSVNFVGANNFEYEQKNEKLELHITGYDSIYTFDRFNIWINEVPLYGQRGINIRKSNSKKFDSTIVLKLSLGENRIETSIININGTESYRIPLMVNYVSYSSNNESIRFIGIGIDKFVDNKYNLRYSVKDIRDLAKKLKEKYGKNILIDTLFNENVSISNVKALKQKLLQTSVNDKVIIAYSGHGMLSKDYDYYLSTYTVNFDKPEQNGLPYDELENLLDSIPARKKLLLIDACHSGEVDKEDLMAINTTTDSMNLKEGEKGIRPVRSKTVGLKNSFELMQSLFVNVGKSTGATIISAAAGTQFALERGDLENGVFTYAILEAMKDHPTIKISELKKIVGERVEQLTNGLQKPTSRNETIAVDWEVW